MFNIPITLNIDDVLSGNINNNKNVENKNEIDIHPIRILYLQNGDVIFLHQGPKSNTPSSSWYLFFSLNNSKSFVIKFIFSSYFICKQSSSNSSSCFILFNVIFQLFLL